MRYVIHGVSVTTLVLAAAVPAYSQSDVATADGRAIGTAVSLLGSETLRNCDTGLQSAPPDFDESIDCDVVSLPGIVSVIANQSVTQANTSFAPDGTAPFVRSLSGDAIVEVLPSDSPDTPTVIELVTSGSEVLLHDPTRPDTSPLEDVVTSRIHALTVNGTPVSLPGEVSPNTTIVAGLPLLILNEQVCDGETIIMDGFGSGCSGVQATKECAVNALHAQALNDGDLLEVVIANAQGRLFVETTECIEGFCANLTASRATASFLSDTPPQGRANPGDRLRFEVRAVAGSGGDVQNLVFVDRLPRNATEPDLDTVLVDGEPTAATIAPCPEVLEGDPPAANTITAEFGGCAGEPFVDTDRTCLTVETGLLPAGETRVLTFEAVAENTRQEDICNTTLLFDAVPIDGVDGLTLCDAQPATALVLGEVLLTTGSGGCAIQPHARRGEAWPLGLLLGLVLLRASRRLRRR